MLVRDDDLFALQSGLMQCRFALTSGERLHVAILDSRIAIEVARTAAAVESAALHERLWRTEAERLAREAAAANERAGAWYASPILWGLVGAVVSAAICVALALTVGG
jgi:anti-sigma-K factor RskA